MTIQLTTSIIKIFENLYCFQTTTFSQYYQLFKKSETILNKFSTWNDNLDAMVSGKDTPTYLSQYFLLREYHMNKFELCTMSTYTQKEWRGRIFFDFFHSIVNVGYYYMFYSTQHFGSILS